MRSNNNTKSVKLNEVQLMVSGLEKYCSKSKQPISLNGVPVFQPLAHLRGRDVADVRVRARKRIERVVARANDDEPDDDVRPLLTSVTGHPPAGPAFKRAAAPEPTFSRHELCARLEGYDLHAATRAGAGDDAGREALLR